MTSVAEMSKMKTHSKEWFNAAFENVDVPDYIKVAAAKICACYNINGEADPGYIANLINDKITDKHTVCPHTTTGEHSTYNDDDYCQWCYQCKF